MKTKPLSATVEGLAATLAEPVSPRLWLFGTLLAAHVSGRHFNDGIGPVELARVLEATDAALLALDPPVEAEAKEEVVPIEEAQAEEPTTEAVATVPPMDEPAVASPVETEPVAETPSGKKGK